MSDTVQPALTADEWESLGARFSRHHNPLERWLRVIRLGWHDDDKGVALDLEHDVTTRTGWDRVVTRVQVETADERHALAALALHGQPFGFTRADVDALRNLCADLHPYCQPFHSLADRIAALLPPESTP